MGDSICLPTLDEFLAQEWPKSSYLKEPGFDQLYVRKSDVGVCVDGEECLKCERVVTLANVVTKPTGQGIMTRFIERLVALGYAVCVENAHSPMLQEGLLRRGFVHCDVNSPTFLFNYEGHLHEWEIG